MSVLKFGGQTMLLKLTSIMERAFQPFLQELLSLMSPINSAKLKYLRLLILNFANFFDKFGVQIMLSNPTFTNDDNDEAIACYVLYSLLINKGSNGTDTFFY